MRNKLFTLILSVLLCLALIPVPAMGEASTGHTAAIQQILTEQGRLWLTFSTSVQDLNGGNMSLLMNGEPLNTVGVNRLKDSALKTSYVFLVDASFNLTAEGLNQARSIIVHLLNMLPANSNIGVITVEEAVDPSGPVSLTDDRAAVVETVKGLKLRRQPQVNKPETKELSLYQAVANMEYLIDSAANVNARRVLVVLSDGIEDAVDGLTVSELAEKLEDVDLLIHTVALMKQSGHDMPAVQEMGSWARKTGGQDLSIQGRSYGQSGSALDNLFKSPENYASNKLYQLAQELANAENEIYAAGFTVQESRLSELASPCGVQMRINQGAQNLIYPSSPRMLEDDIRAELRQTSGSAAVMLTAAPTAVPTAVTTPVPTQSAAPVSTPVQNPATQAPEQEQSAALPTDENQMVADSGVQEQAEETVDVEQVLAQVATPTVLTGNATIDGILNGVISFMTQEAFFGLPMWVFFAIGAAVLILLIVIIVLIVRGKRKKHAAEDIGVSINPMLEDVPQFEAPIFDTPMFDNASFEDGKTFDPSRANVNAPGDNERTVAMGGVDIPMTMPGGMVPPAMGPKPIRLILTEMQVAAPKQYLHVTADPITVVGRKAGVANWVLPGNESLSGRHFQIERQGEKLILTDLNSTNGTFVNGQRISGPVQIDQDMRITLGRITYAFNWMYA